MQTILHNTDTDIHTLITKRFSPRGFAETPVHMEVLHSLLDAARWAPSSYNEQPWRFIVARKEDGEAYERILLTLNERNRQWAQSAPVLMIAVTSTIVARNGAKNRYAMYDLGQAMATMTMQATHMDLYVHQMGGFDSALAKEVLGLPDDFEAAAAVAVGYLPEDMDSGQTESRRKSRVRKDIAEIAFRGSWGRQLFPTMN